MKVLIGMVTCLGGLAHAGSAMGFEESALGTEPRSMRTSEAGNEALDRGVRANGDSRLKPGTRIVGHTDVVGRSGPVGLALQTGLFLRRTFSVDEQGEYERAYVQGGVGVRWTPASIEPEAHVEYLPIPMLTLRGEAAAMRFLGANQGLLSFSSKDAPFGSEELSRREGDEQSAWGVRAGLSVQSRVRFEPVLVRNTFRVLSYHYDEDVGPYAYDSEHDTLLGTSDWLFSSRTEALFELYRGAGARTLLLGPMFEWTRTVETELSRNRVGVSSFYVPVDEFAGLARPRLYAQAGVNVSDPNRKGDAFASLGLGADLE